jgi:hypothetical protein
MMVLTFIEMILVLMITNQTFLLPWRAIMQGAIFFLVIIGKYVFLLKQCI